MLSPKFDQLVKDLQILPSVGQKSAQRMALHLLSKNRSAGLALAQSLLVAMSEIKECTLCHSFSDDEVCGICNDIRRDDGLLCVVEQASDVVAIEQSGAYRGKYFVLGGHLSPIDGIGADDLHIDELVALAKSKVINELIIATGATIEGQTTAFFIHNALSTHIAKITRLAQGMPMGGELGYVDSLTLQQALHNRGVL
ncbi:recombination mediator RecR [Moraxella oblonga]|uniref:recombination mediator RecR n=1 Tax=Moraxella oblonga TaxID=200413 RepID=UPI000836FA15|nr:recombination mediator RecR [Moraxella oblonga]